MFFSKSIVLGLFFCLLGVGLVLGKEPAYMPESYFSRAVSRAISDHVGSGYCGRGLWSVLNYLGYEGLVSADGQDWEKVLESAGWVPVLCKDPKSAPLGSVLVYLSDLRLFGKNLVGTKGGIFGHAELVVLNEGKRYYVSDAPRKRPGGTVPYNFTRRAWVPPGTDVVGVVKVVPRHQLPSVCAEASSMLLEERLAASRYFFSYSVGLR